MEVVITRDSLHSPWGMRIVGGAEFNHSPLMVAKITLHSCAFGVLRVGDIILAINGLSTAGMRHADAVHMVQSAGTCRLVVGRSPGNARCRSVEPPASIMRPSSAMSSMSTTMSRRHDEKTPLPSNSQLASLMHQSVLGGHKHRPRGMTSADLLARCMHVPDDVTSYLPRAPRRSSSVMSDRHSPPVLDYGGAKQAIGVWTPPSNCPSARLAHTQYNSPMKMYAPRNIANMIEQQTGTKISWQKKPSVRFADDIAGMEGRRYD